MTPADIAAALLRTTLATSAAALAAWALLAWLRIDAPRIHRIAWLLVIAQGWLFFPLTIEIETESPPTTTTKRAAGLVPAGITERSSIAFLTEALRCREPFATSDSPLMDARQSPKALDPLSLPIIAIASWLLGAITLAAIAVYRYWQVLRTLPLGSPPDDPAWQAEWHAARTAAQLRRRQPVDLRITTSLGPLLHWAPWAYLILVPRPLWTALAAPQRQAILRHELAHLRRGDLWKSLAIRILALPQWFNPLAWRAIRRFDEAAEWACDDAAAATTDGRLTFAESLLQSAEYAVPFPASAPAARGVLTRRTHRLVSPRFKEESKMKLLVPPLLLLLLAMFQTLRIERVVADETPQEPLSFQDWSLVEQLRIPVGERLKNTERLHSQLKLCAEMHRRFDYAAKAIYTIEPPDVVAVTLRLDAHVKRKGLRSLPESAEDLLEGRKCVVHMDGTIDLGELGFINIGGKTIDEATRVVAGQLIQFADSVSLSVHSSNSRVIYVIVEDADGASEVTRVPMPYPLRPDHNIANAIEQGFGVDSGLMRSQDFSKCKVSLRRPANEPGTNNEYAIEWDREKNVPAEYHNYPLIPGDQLLISLPRLADPSGAAASPSKRSKTGNAPTRESIVPATPVEAKTVYRLQPFDTLKLRVARPHRPAHALTWGDIAGEFTVDRNGAIELGSDLEVVTVACLSVSEARAEIQRQLRKESPDCEVKLILSTLAAEKYVISIQRADGTEIAVGALRPDYLSKSDFLEWSSFRSFIAELTPISEVKLERAGPHGSAESIELSTVWDAIQAPQMRANEHNIRPGDRLIITVADDWQPRIYPQWLVPC
ncbi:MAG: hypothetical protein C0485_13445 [Pirellula sp.]|nr:hypothetical protein [Pirellula sp.]